MEGARSSQPSGRVSGEVLSRDGTGQQFQSPAMNANRRESKVEVVMLAKKARRSFRLLGAYMLATAKVQPRTDTSAQSRRPSRDNACERRVCVGWSKM